MFSLFLVNVIVMIYVYVKIEIYKAKGTSLNIDFSGYTLGFIRKVVGLIIYLGLLFLLRLFFPFTNHNEILIEWVINQFLIMVMIPARNIETGMIFTHLITDCLEDARARDGTQLKRFSHKYFLFFVNNAKFAKN